MTFRLNVFFRKCMTQGLLALLIIVCSGNTIFTSGLLVNGRSVVEKTSEAEEESTEENRSNVPATASRRRSGWNLDKARVRAIFQQELGRALNYWKHIAPALPAPESPTLSFKTPLFVLYNQLKYHL